MLLTRRCYTIQREWPDDFRNQALTRFEMQSGILSTMAIFHQLSPEFMIWGAAMEPEINNVAADLQAYVAGRRDSVRESALLRRLRALPQPDRLALLTPLLELKSRTALVLIGRAQLSRSDYLEIFKLGLTKGDASSVSWWMDATVPHIGWRRTLSVLRGTLATNPRGGAFALYHVPWVCRAKGKLSGALPTRELAMEFGRLVVQYHENGHRVVDDNTFDRLKNNLSNHE